MVLLFRYIDWVFLKILEKSLKQTWDILIWNFGGVFFFVCLFVWWTRYKPQSYFTKLLTIQALQKQLVDSFKPISFQFIANYLQITVPECLKDLNLIEFSEEYNNIVTRINELYSSLEINLDRLNVEAL